MAGSLSATVKDNNNNVISGATVSWSGNNDEVATIDANTGSVTLVSAGAVTFTAAYAGVSGQYAGSSATYQMTVTNSAPYVQPTVIEITPNYSFWGKTAQFSGNDYSELTGSKDNVTLAWSKGAGSTYANTNAMRFYKDNELTFTAPTGYEIKSILIAGENLPSDLGFSPEEFDTETLTWSGSSSSVTMSRPSNASSYVTINKYTITIGLPSTDPTINADDVDIAYNATAGIIEFSIGNEPSPAGTLTASTESDWLTVGTVGANVPFTCTENNTAAERTATVTLSYSYGNNESVTKEVTVTQARNPNVVPTIAQVRDQGTGSAVTKGVVTTITGSEKNKTAYIQDATAAIVVYGDFTAAVGDEIRVSGTLSAYKGLLEFTNPTVTVLSSGNTVAPTVMTIAEINSSSNQGWYVKIEDATVTVKDGQNTTIAQGENTILVHGITGVEYGVNDIITLEGNIGCFNTVQIANPTNVTVQEVTTPMIVVTPSVANCAATDEEGTLNITYENLPIEGVDDFKIEFYEAVGGNPSGEPDWIHVEIAEQDPNIGEGYVVSYIMDPNTGEARSAYFVVSANDSDGVAVSSDFVTINQAAPVVDYATLPFSWTSNYGSAPQGITNSDVSTGGSGSNAYLKFDANDDNIVLKINERPGVLSFTIKGNPSSGTAIEGTFKVQVSVDGLDYSDLETYTNISNSNHEESFAAIPGNVRFIKWVYVNKVSGNVALSNISLTELQPAAPDTYDRNLTAGDGGYWGTFYNGVADYQLPEGAQAFTMNSSKQLYRLGSNGRVIPAGTAVVIIADVEAVTLTKGGSPEAVATNGGDNILLGDDFPVEGDGTQYVLGKKNNVIGFYKFQGSEIPANRAYYVVSE